MTRPQPGATGHGRDSVDDPRDPLLVRAILNLYPRPWRERYGEEFASLLTDLTAASPRPGHVRLIADAASGALDARLHPPGGSTMPERIRRHITAAMCAAFAFAIAIASLAKMREGPAFGAATRGHAAVAVSLDILRGAAVVAAVMVLAGALPLAWTAIRQAATARQADLIRPLAIGPAAVTGWLAVAWTTAGWAGQPGAHSGPNIAAVTALTVLGAAAGGAVVWAAAAVIRRADLTPRLLRAEVLPMAVLSVCMATATGADISWGLAIRAAGSGLFQSSNGLIATPLAPNWAGSALVLAAATAVTAAATMRAARQLLLPAAGEARQN
jgi:hypothetical protein